jgi:hypothetical protein
VLSKLLKKVGLLEGAASHRQADLYTLCQNLNPPSPHFSQVLSTLAQLILTVGCSAGPSLRLAVQLRGPSQLPLLLPLCHILPAGLRLCAGKALPFSLLLSPDSQLVPQSTRCLRHVSRHEGGENDRNQVRSPVGMDLESPSGQGWGRELTSGDTMRCSGSHFGPHADVRLSRLQPRSCVCWLFQNGIMSIVMLLAWTLPDLFAFPECVRCITHLGFDWCSTFLSARHCTI